MPQKRHTHSLSHKQPLSRLITIDHSTSDPYRGSAKLGCPFSETD